MSLVTCHLSPVTCQKIKFPLKKFKKKILLKNWTKWWSELVEGLLSTWPTPSSFFLMFFYVWEWCSKLISDCLVLKSCLAWLSFWTSVIQALTKQFFLSYIGKRSLGRKSQQTQALSGTLLSFCLTSVKALCIHGRIYLAWSIVFTVTMHYAKKDELIF